MLKITKRDFVIKMATNPTVFYGCFHRVESEHEGLHELESILEKLNPDSKNENRRKCIPHPTFLEFYGGSVLHLKNNAKYFQYNNFLIYFETINNSKNRYTSRNDVEVVACVYAL